MKPKKTKLEKFKDDFQKFMAKYPDVQVYGNQNGDPIAFHFDGIKSHSIKLKDS